MVRVGCEFLFDSVFPTPLISQVKVRTDDPHRVVRETSSLEPVVDSSEYLDAFGNRCWRLVAPVGRLALRYDAEVDVSPEPDLVVADAPQVPVVLKSCAAAALVSGNSPAMAWLASRSQGSQLAEITGLLWLVAPIQGVS